MSKLDHLTVSASCDDSCCLTVLSTLDELAEDTCCETVLSYVDKIDVDVNLVKTTINQTVVPELMSIESKLDHWVGPVVETIDSKIDLLLDDTCCETILSKLDHLTVSASCDDSCCQSILSKLDELTVTASCDDSCCLTILSKLDELTVSASCDDSCCLTVLSTLDELAEDACCETVLSYVDKIDVDVNLVKTTINQTVVPELISIESKLDHWVGPVVETIDSKIDLLLDDTCCETILSKLDYLTVTASCDDSCCLTILSKLDELTVNASCDDSCCLTINSKLDTIVIPELISIYSKLDECCEDDDDDLKTILSYSDVISTNVNTLVDHTEGTIVPELISIESKLDHWVGPVVETINSKIDVLTIDCSIDECCDTLNSKLDVVDSKIDSLVLDDCCDVIGDKDDVSYPCSAFSTVDQIDQAELTVIEWLKTIYRELRGGFDDCNNDECDNGEEEEDD